MRKLICALLVLVMLFCSCTAADSGDKSSDAASKVSSGSASKVSSEAESKEPVVPAVNDYSSRSYPVVDILDYLKLTGRYDQRKVQIGSEMGISMDNACNYIGFTADCEGDVTIDINLHIQKAENFSKDRYFTIYVDGVKQEGRPSISGEGFIEKKCTLTVATGLKRGKHTFEVYRQNEPLHGAMLLLNINMKGVPLLEKPADKDLYIEFIGDSITAGYGNLIAKGVENSGHALYSDSTSTYAFLTAQALNADLSVVCRSGMGFSMSQFSFEGFYNDTCHITYPGKTYTVTRRPDIIVINLGTNDFNYSDKATIAEYTKKAIETIRKVNPDSKIVWAYGLMGSHLETEIMKGLNDAGGEAKGLYYCPLTTDYSGGGGHPSLAGHKAGAEALTKFIKDKGLDK